MRDLKIAGLMLWSLIVWPTYIGVAGILWLIGFIIVPFAAEFGLYETRESKKWPGRQIVAWKYKILWLWGNEEDGIDGRRSGLGWPCASEQMWWQDECNAHNESYVEQIVMWSVGRNPIGNLRFVWPFGTNLKPRPWQYYIPVDGSVGTAPVDRDLYVWAVGNVINIEQAFKANPANTYWFFAWRGLFSGFWLIYRGWQFRIGWKFMPADYIYIEPDDYRRKGVGFALQLQRK